MSMFDKMRVKTLWHMAVMSTPQRVILNGFHLFLILTICLYNSKQIFFSISVYTCKTLFLSIIGSDTNSCLNQNDTCNDINRVIERS